MSKTVKLTWKNRSTGNGVQQQIYRKLDNDSEVLIATVAGDVRAYGDLTPAGVEVADYRVSTIVNYNGTDYSASTTNLTVNLLQPMLVTPSAATITIESISNLEIDWGDGTVQTVRTGGGVYVPAGNTYTHTYADTFADKVISIKQLTGSDPIQFFRSDAIKEVRQWYSGGYSSTTVSGLDVSFFGLGANLTTVPTVAPPNTTNIAALFYAATIFNQNINSWDISSVVNLTYLFIMCSAFNQPLDQWNTSSVTNMKGMFTGAGAFNQNISGWNTANVTNMTGMFEEATAFNQDISGWNISAVTVIENLFYNAAAFNQPLNNWNVSNVTNMKAVFYGAKAFNQPLNSWNTSNVTDMRGMFQGATVFNQPIGSWNTSNVTNMMNMFDNAQAFNGDITSWQVSKVTNMQSMFNNAKVFNQNISGWNTSKVTTMVSMFNGALVFTQDLTQWCVPLIISLPPNFATGSNLLPEYRPVWGTCPRGENIAPNEMYFTTTAGTIDFYGVAGDQIVLNGGNTLTLETDSMYGITVPSGKHKLVLVETRSQDYVGLGGAALVEIHNFPTLGSVNTFDTCPNNSSPNLVKVPTTLPSNITHIQYMFSGATSFNQDISMWDTSNVTLMYHTFSGASAFNQDISGWNTGSVTQMYNMFENAISFNQDLSQWCVPMITSLPTNFATGASLFTSDKHPVWGTCPRGENLV